MKQADHPLAAVLARHQRRTIFQRGPALGREHGIGFGEHLPVDGDVLGHRKARERTVGCEGGQMLRLFPGQTAAEAASAAPQLHRHQVVVGLRQSGAGKTHQHAALFDPGVEPLADLRRQRADVRQHDHRQFLIEKLRDRLLRGNPAVAEPHVGEWSERTGEIEDRCEQRLRGVAGRAACNSDRPPAPSFVEQLHGARRSLARDFKARDIVAQLDRKVE